MARPQQPPLLHLTLALAISKSAFPLADNNPSNKICLVSEIDGGMGALPCKISREINGKCLTRPEEEDGELFYEPLEDPVVKAELDKGHEKYNRLGF